MNESSLPSLSDLPRVGRWTSKDPSGLRGSDISLYAYALGAPTNYLDSSGHDPERAADLGENILEYIIYCSIVADSVWNESRKMVFASGREQSDYLHAATACKITERYGPIRGGTASYLKEGRSTIDYCVECVTNLLRGNRPRPPGEFWEDTRKDLDAAGAGIREARTPSPETRP